MGASTSDLGNFSRLSGSDSILYLNYILPFCIVNGG